MTIEIFDDTNNEAINDGNASFMYDCQIAFRGDDFFGKMLLAHPDGGMIVRLNRCLIAPLELFSDDEIRDIMSRPLPHELDRNLNGDDRDRSD